MYKKDRSNKAVEIEIIKQPKGTHKQDGTDGKDSHTQDDKRFNKKIGGLLGWIKHVNVIKNIT